MVGFCLEDWKPLFFPVCFFFSLFLTFGLWIFFFLVATLIESLPVFTGVGGAGRGQGWAVLSLFRTETPALLMSLLPPVPLPPLRLHDADGYEASSAP